MNTISLSTVIEGYLLDARARQLSPKTLLDYQNAFRHLREFIGDPPFADIVTDDIRRFLGHLRDAPVEPSGVAPRRKRVLSKKSVLNIYIALSALWTWAVTEGLASSHVVRAISPPTPEKPAIEPFSRSDVKAMLEACEYTREYGRPGKRTCRNKRPTAQRDKALILLMLDTGVRVSEICENPGLGTHGMRIRDVDLRNHRIKVIGKGARERILPISHRTAKALWRYLVKREDADADDPVFLNSRGEPLTISGLQRLIARLGERAGVKNAHPHRFRHTFAINFLRNGGNALELQRLLGHSSLEMVQRYVAIAQVDIERAHQKASPVSNWRL